MKAFRWNVETPRQARDLLAVLASYDLFQYENKVKGDYCNAGGLEVLIDGEWQEWEDAEGDGIDHADLDKIDSAEREPSPDHFAHPDDYSRVMADWKARHP